SISHRAVILGSIANGKTSITNLLEGEDVLANIRAFQAMGVNIIRNIDEQDPIYFIDGVGMDGLESPGQDLDLGNSGTAFRLITGLLASHKFSSTLTGDESLLQRPMSRIIEPLRQMGAIIDSENGKPPLSIEPCNGLTGIQYRPVVASAQVKSAVLLAGLRASGETRLIESALTRDHTEKLLSGFGYPISVSGTDICLEGGHALTATQIDVPADLSSAAFFIVAALIVPGSRLELKDVGINPRRTGILTILRRMGADIEITHRRIQGGEDVADLIITSSSLNGCEISGDDVAFAIDEMPVICIAAAAANGETIIHGASELRVKESDRIKAVTEGLQRLGIEVEERVDGMKIRGGKFLSAEIDSYRDHRIAMAFSVAGMIAKGDIKIMNCENVATSFPNFVELANQAGMWITAE
ncbi:MAG: 3-phosphoshikimate 1-carboxyvinyltransferase, partial [Gammaproteobacteria bacterium]|nr:3-phosphoshikimate 1-carboxyvinyltransferase [Gammaproteobacteria bacterium]